ncbi:MAG TPA: DUF3333 domain-containing protein, partial [Desulfocapsa sulfexigens]|nr:DUF3333 domain-containing protein [Desulfocapsa sulfexigens]
MQEEKKESTMDKVKVGLAARYRRERRFRLFGLGAIIASISFLGLLFATIATNGWSAFQQTEILLDVHFDAEQFDVDALSTANYGALVKTSMKNLFPDVKGRSDKRKLYELVSTGASYKLQNMVANDTSIIGSTRKLWLPADDEVDMFLKGYISRDVPESDRRLNDKQVGWIDQLVEGGRLEKKFNTTFFTAGDSREPELAGIRGAAVGSLFTLAVTLLLSFPIGVATAVYLEEFAPRNKWTDIIEVNINNLAAVPSIVFGLLGLAVFLNVFGMPRSAPLVGGLVLTLMTLPTIIIASRASLKSVPPS